MGDSCEKLNRQYDNENDYFTFYDLPVQFNPDLNAVKAKFYELSKKYHPDFYANESDEKQQEVLNLSTINNKAYQTLTDPHKRLRYILELKGVVQANENYQLPQLFLMEMMDVNEAIMDMEFEPEATKVQKAKAEVDAIEMGLFNELQQYTKQFDTGDSANQQQLLLSIKDIYYREKYVNRIQERLLKLSSRL